MFKVVPDQLKMGDGWVRCGHCAEVFDAAAHLQAPAVVPDTPPPSLSVPPSAQPAPEAFITQGPHADMPPATVDVLLGDAAAVDDGPAPDWAPPAAHQTWDETAGQEILVSDPPALSVDVDLNERRAPSPEDEEDIPSSLLLHTATHDGLLESDISAATVDGITVPADMEEGDEAAATRSSDFSFVRQAERKAFWRRPLVRWVLLLLCMGLLGVLGFQAMVQHRDEIAARVPTLRPLLEQACQRLGCEVSARRHIESVVIDSSSFNKTRGDTYQLSLTLKNTAATVVATPSIELTLTDAQDQAILRRVLQPVDLGVAPELPAQGDANVSLPIGVAGEAGSARIAGYRLLAFYP